MTQSAPNAGQQHRYETTAAYHRAIIRVISHLNENFKEQHTLNDMADVAVISPFHFSRIFREITGVSPVRFLYALRIAEAKRLVLTTRLKVIDICYAVGYNSLGSFNNRFLSLVGYSPRRIRHMATNIDPIELRRAIEERARETSMNGHDHYSMRGEVRAHRDFSGVSMVALFPGISQNAYPIASTLADDRGYGLPPVRHGGVYFAMAVGLNWYNSMAEFLLQPDFLRAIIPPVRLSPDGIRNQINFHLRARSLVDPPIPPSLTPRLVDEFIQAPEDANTGRFEALERHSIAS